jgi:CBS domain-containing protein
MNRVCEILAGKGSQVWAISRDASVLDAARLMREQNIGGLLVSDDSRLVGIFTERDVLKRIVAEGRDPATTRVEEVMSREVACCSPDTTIEEARAVMRDRRIRHLPVMDHDQLVGLVSIGDLNAYQLHDQELTIHILNEYLYGRV